MAAGSPVTATRQRTETGAIYTLGVELIVEAHVTLEIVYSDQKVAEDKGYTMVRSDSLNSNAGTVSNDTTSAQASHAASNNTNTTASTGTSANSGSQHQVVNTMMAMDKQGDIKFN